MPCRILYGEDPQSLGVPEAAQEARGSGGIYDGGWG